MTGHSRAGVAELTAVVFPVVLSSSILYGVVTYQIVFVHTTVGAGRYKSDLVTPEEAWEKQQVRKQGSQG